MTLLTTDLRLSAQKALLGRVWDGLRGVFVQVFERFALIYFYHEDVLNSLHRKLYEEAMASILKDIKSNAGNEETEVIYNVLQIEPPDIPELGNCVFLRYEPLFLDDEESKYWLSFRDTNQIRSNYFASYRVLLLECLDELNPPQDVAKGLRLIVQNGLIREVPPSLRAVTMEFKSEKTDISFFVDGAIQEADRDLTNSAFAEIKSDIEAWEPTKTLQVEGRIARLDYPKKLPKTSEVLYLRYEAPTLSSRLMQAIKKFMQSVDEKFVDDCI